MPAMEIEDGQARPGPHTVVVADAGQLHVPTLTPAERRATSAIIRAIHGRPSGPHRGLCDNPALGYLWSDRIDSGGVVLAKVFSCAVVGLDGVLVEVEVDVGQGVPGMVVVGLPDAAVRESQDRVRAAIRNSGGRFPIGRVTVNLAPADLKKAGPTYDLPIALGILLASNQVAPSPQLDDALVAGELSLDGVVRHTPGIISMISTAAANGMRRAFVPAVDATEAALVGEVEIIPVRTLVDLVNHLSGEAPIAPHSPDSTPPESLYLGVDFSEVKGQEHVKRGLEIAAAGAHNALLSARPARARRCWPAPSPPSCRR